METLHGPASLAHGSVAGFLIGSIHSAHSDRLVGEPIRPNWSTAGPLATNREESGASYEQSVSPIQVSSMPNSNRLLLR